MRTVVPAFAVALIVVAAACNKATTTPTTPTPPTPPANSAPVITSMSVTPPFLIASLTTFQAAGSATEADNDTLTYTWTIGTQTVTGRNISGTFTGEGTGTFRLTVTDGRGGSATDTRTLTVGTMAGNWIVTIPNPCGGGGFPLTLTQSTGGVVLGSGVAGAAYCAAPAGSTYRVDPAEPGSIDANGNVNIRIKVGVFLDFYIRGAMQNTGRSVVGGAFGSGLNGAATTMTKQ